MLLELVHNITLLVALGVLIHFFAGRIESRRGLFRLLTGFAFGLTAIAGMLTPLKFAPGVIYDGRSIIISLAGFFGGPLTALVSALMAGAFRLYIGGAGAWVGVGVIVEAALVGSVHHVLRLRDKRWEKIFPMWLSSLIVHIIMMLLQLALPGGMGWDVAWKVGPFVLLFYPPAFVVIAMVFLESWRKRSLERKLEKEKEKYRLVAEHASDVVWTFDLKEKRYTYVSPSSFRMFGYTPEEALKIRLEDHIAGDALQPSMEMVYKAAEVGGFKTGQHVFECPQKKKDGSLIWTEISASFAKDKKGVPVTLIGVTRDITKRKEEEARHALLLKAIEQAGESIMITDRDGAIQYVNPAFEKVTGYSPREVLGKNPSFLKGGTRDHEFYEAMWDALTHGKTWQGLMVNKKRDGTFFTEKSVISPILGEDGAITSYVAVKQDVTRELALEEEYRQAHKMEAVGHLAGGIAHDFNNILQVVLGYAQLLSTRCDEGDKSAEYVAEIIRGAERASTLTKQLLAFSRRQVMEPRVLQINNLVKNLLNMLQRIIGEHIHLDWIPGARLGAVYADSAMIEQVLMNLVVNARDAMPEGGRLIIETQNVLIDSEYCSHHLWAAPGRFVLLSVTDTGVGMDKETLEMVFEPFFTTKGEGKGTGLGLSTAFGIIKQHDGMITAYSEPGQGSTFKIYLPVTERKAASVGPLIQGAVRGGNETLLVAEDDPAVRKMAVSVLEEAGYTVLSARNGEEALEMYYSRSEKISLLLLDVVMPVKNGYEVWEEIRESHPHLPVLFSSGYSKTAVHTNFILTEGLQLIQKPYGPEEVLRRVRQLLDEKKKE